MGEGICLSPEGKGRCRGELGNWLFDDFPPCEWGVVATEFQCFINVLEAALNISVLLNFQNTVSFFFFFFSLFLYHKSIQVKFVFCNFQLCKTLTRVYLKRVQE